MRRHARSILIPLLLALGVSLGLVDAVQPLELHQSPSAGLYNEEHVLAALDTVSGDAPLPHVLGPLSLPLAAGAALPAAEPRVFATPLRHTGPRAPPLV
ncbi:MAG TPA: hypothetical protein VFO18_00920 [Methylomirabilota bacterium]|nr:hypothetical protein [Methylomirabilota bacterium]